MSDLTQIPLTLQPRAPPQPMPYIFLASSSEALRLVVHPLETIFGNRARLMPWTSDAAHAQGITFFESLMNITKICDYSIVVLSGDDKRISRGNLSVMPRDNTILELGAFRATAPADRLYIVAEKSILEQGIPSDLLGQHFTLFERDSTGTSLTAESLTAITAQAGRLLEHWSRRPVSYRLLPSTALAHGYWCNFLEHFVRHVQGSGGVNVRLEDGTDLHRDVAEITFNVVMPESLDQFADPRGFISTATQGARLRKAEVLIGDRSHRNPHVWTLATNTNGRLWLFDFPTTLKALHGAVQNVIARPSGMLTDTDHQRLAQDSELNAFHAFLSWKVTETHCGDIVEVHRASPGQVLEIPNRNTDDQTNAA